MKSNGKMDSDYKVVMQENTARLFSDGREVCNLSGMNISGSSTGFDYLG